MLLPPNLGQAAISPSPVAASANGAAQTNTATIAAVAGALNYLEGFDITGGGATAASVIDVTVTGLAAGTLHFEVAVPAGATTGIGGTGSPGFVSVRFPTPQPASGKNQAIAVVVPSFGAGNTTAGVVAYGLQQ